MKRILRSVACLVLFSIVLAPYPARALNDQPILVKDVFPGLGSAYPNQLVAVNGQLFFVAESLVQPSGPYEISTGRELWRSDGTASGTVLVKDLNPAYTGNTGAGGNLGNLVNVNGRLYFTADDGRYGTELWQTTGTDAGTVLVRDIWPGPNPSLIDWVGSAEGVLYLRADDGLHGRELWRSDGTSQGTVLVQDIWPGPTGSAPWPATSIASTVYFGADDGLHGRELWHSDGTADGTSLIKDIWPGTHNILPTWLTPFRGLVYFAANDNVSGPELWRSDGSEAGTALVQDSYPGPIGSGPGWLTVAGDSLFFVAHGGEAEGQELWISDGTSNGTGLVKDIWPGVGNSTPTELTPAGDTVYFVADDGVHGRELWKSDGTPNGTVLVKDIYAGSDSSHPYWLTVVGRSLFFAAEDGVHGQELWRSDGTVDGTMLVMDIYPGTDSAGPQSLTAVNGALFFAANDEQHGFELWMVPRAERTAIRIDILPGSEDNCVNHNGRGVIPVAILGSPDFDATQVDPDTVELAGMGAKATGKLLAHTQDSNGDGFLDLVVQIADGEGIFAAGQSVATLTGNLVDGTELEGTDTICIVPQPSKSGTRTLAANPEDIPPGARLFLPTLGQ